MVSFIETESRMVVTTGWGKTEKTSRLMDTVSEMQDDNVLEICLTTLNILNSAELHFKMVKKVHFVLCIFTTIKKKRGMQIVR